MITERYNEWSVDVKLNRERNGSFIGTCPTCRLWNSHTDDCPVATKEYWKHARGLALQQEDRARKRAAYLLSECRRMHASIATLKAENNKLRKKCSLKTN